MSKAERLAIVSRVTAAVFGSLVLALVLAVSLALWVPGARTLGTALGVTLVIPIWVAAMCPGFLAKSPWKPWLGYLGTAAALAAFAWLTRPGSTG